MKTMHQLSQYLGLIIILTFFGCNQNSENASYEMAEGKVISESVEKDFEPTERKLIKEGYIEFETEDINLSRQIIFQAVDKYQCYISSDWEYKTPDRISNTVVIQVPADKFDLFLKDATNGVEKFDSKEINVKDVTEEFIDIQARLKIKKELENRYLDLLKQAKKVTDILEIEKQIGQIRSEIESIEGRLKFLQDRVSFSSLTMTFYESIPKQTEFGEKFKNAFRNGWDNLIWFFVFLINIWPFVLIGLGLIIGIRIYKRR